MSNDGFDAQALIDAMAPFVDLPVEEAYRPGVAAHLKAAYLIAQNVLAVELEDDAEPAPVYRP